MSYLELLTYLAPETIVVVAAFGALLVDLTTLRGSSHRNRMQAGAWLTVLGCAGAMTALFLSPLATPVGYLDGMLVLNPLSQLVKLVLLALTIFTALTTLESNFTDHAGEYFALLLLATAGMMFLVSTENILLIFVSLELLSLSLYILTAFNKRSIRSAEAALKYFLFGGMSAAFMLFGLSLVYGLSGEIILSTIASKLAGPKLDPLLYLALLMVVTGLGFKVAVVPFHLWAPDAYEGAPVASAAFIASGSKVASFFVLAKVVMVGFGSAGGGIGWPHVAQGWVPLLALMAALSMVVGNLAAIAQKSVRRLLAYSAIAQAGYMIVGLLANDEHGLASLLFYATTYALTVVGAFAVVAVVEERGSADGFAAYAGLRQRSPLLAFCMMIFMLSLAGIPPLAGFFGKFYLFSAALRPAPQNLGLRWLVILAIAMSAISLYYYLQVLKQVLVHPPSPNAPELVPGRSTCWPIGLLAGLVVGLGLMPSLLLQPLLAALGFVR